MYIFIVNIKAGNGRAKRIFLKLQKTELYKRLESKYYYTKYEGHAEEIARSLVHLQGIKAMIVVGGDGTLHEVINGVDHYVVPIAFIPGGSGNDFARGIKLRDSPLEILEKVVGGTADAVYYLGNYHMDGSGKRNFVNSMGFGFDALIAEKANNAFYKRILNFLNMGKLSYVIALLQIIITFKPMELELKDNGKVTKLKDCWMVSITNHPYYGGGMKINPRSKVQPHKFSVLIIHSISKWKVLALFITVFTGKHIHYQEVEVFETTSLEVTTKKSINYQVDGQTDTCYTCKITKEREGIPILGTAEKDQQGNS
ncbi:diacylglycerol/lipid kinase family protein [Virgibacillus kimchii]